MNSILTEVFLLSGWESAIRDDIIWGSVGAVTLMFLCTGTMVVCFKHVGITDMDRERKKMSVKTLGSWSAHAWSTRPGNPSGTAAL